MADVNLVRVFELLRSLFELLWNKPEGLPAREVLAFLPEITNLTEYERETASPFNMPRYEKIVRIAIIPLVKAGWLSKSDKGRWSITDEGREACRRYPNVRELYTEAVRLFEERGQSIPAILLTTEVAKELAWEQIQRYLMEMKRTEFQHLVADLLVAMGYYLAWVAPPDKDRGQVDMVVKVDPLGAKGAQILVQIKHKGQTITSEGLRSFLSGLGASHYGLLISSGGFTEGIREEALNDAYRRVTLWGVEDIFDLWIRYYTELDQDAHARLPIEAVYFLSGIK